MKAAQFSTVVLVSMLLMAFGGQARADVHPALRGIQTGKMLPAPDSLNVDAYRAWTESVRQALGLKDFISGFTDYMFEWYENEKDRGLPTEVFQAEDSIYVNVDRPRAEAAELEDLGEIESNTTIGAEVYAEMDGTIEQVMEVMLYRWGKPTGKAEGETHPAPSPFSLRTEYFAPNPEWGPHAYANISSRKNGGILSDLDDRYIVLVYGNASRGYDLVMQYFAPHEKTATKKSLGIAIIRPLKNGKTAFKITTRYQGQSYSLIPFGRSLFGFNEGKVRAVQTDFGRILAEYKKEGKISEIYPVIQEINPNQDNGSPNQNSLDK